MKTLPLFVLILTAGCEGFGQGTLLFSNRPLQPALSNARVLYDSGRGVLGPADGRFVAQLYAAPPGATLQPLGSPVPFADSADWDRGYVTDETVVTVPGVLPGAPVRVRMAAWASALGGSLEAAQASGLGNYGLSGIVTVFAGGEIPAPLLGMQGFTISSIMEVRGSLPHPKAPPVRWAANGHDYERVAAKGITWGEARLAAEARTFQGRAGHLVTVNSAEENAFLVSEDSLEYMSDTLSLKHCWMGAFREAGAPGAGPAWRWVTDEGFQYDHWEPGQPAPAPTGTNFAWFSTRDTAGRRWANTPVPEEPAAGYVVEYEPATDSPSQIQYVTNVVRVSTFAGRGRPQLDNPQRFGRLQGIGSEVGLGAITGLAVDPRGWLSISDADFPLLRQIRAQGFVQFLAGTGQEGDADGAGSAASFREPRGMAVDTAGNVFVADTGNHRIRKVTSDGQVSTWAGNGVAAFVDGRAAEASFHRPSALVVDPDGNLWVADTGNHAIRHVSADGQVTTWVGNGVAGGSDGTRSTVRLNAPAGIARDGQNRLYITEFGGHRVRRVEADGNVSTVAGDPAGQRGYIDGLGVEARFERPTGIAVDASGLIYVADTGNHAIRRVTPEGRVETLAGAGLADFVEGEGKAARFASPTGIAVGTNGTVWVNDTDNRRVRRILVDRSPEALPVITKQPTNLTVVVGDLARVSVEATGEGPLAYFLRWPWWWSESGVVSDQPNVEFVATGGSTPVEYQVLVGNASGWVTSSTFQVNLQQPSIPVGAPVTVTKVTEAAFAPEAIWNEPASFPRGGIALDPLGNLVVAQCAPALIRQVTPAGSVKTLAGIDEGYRDGPVSGARFRNPSDLCIDAAGNIFIADTLNQRIRRLTPEGVVSTVAGSGAAGWVDGPAVGARFDWPTGIARGPEGSLYVADFRNHALRRIPPDGRVETWAGDGTPGNVNGPRQTARLYLPYRVAVDEAGNVYFTERARFTVRRISPAGEVSVFAGDGTSGYRDGPSAQARFSQPGALAVAPDGALWIVDEDNQVIRRISPAGQVETVAGSGLTIWGKDEGFQTPNGIALVSSGIAYVMDKGSRIQRITLADPDPNHPLPGLRLVKIAGKYYVTWPEAAPGIRLQQATNLVAGDWWDVPNTDGSSSVEIRATGATGFFRLIRN